MIDLLIDFYDTMVLMYDRNLFGFLFILACIVVNGILILRFLSSLFFPAKQEEEIEQEPKVQEEDSNEEEPSYTFSDDFDIDEAYANADYETRQSFDYKLWQMEKEEEARLFFRKYAPFDSILLFVLKGTEVFL